MILPAEIFGYNLFTFSVSTLAFFQSCFLRDNNEVHFSVFILFFNSIFIVFFVLTFVVLRYVILSVLCASVRCEDSYFSVFCDSNQAERFWSSLSSCHTISTDLPDPLSPHLPIVHCFWQVFYNPYRHIAVESRFGLVVLALLVRVKGSTRVHQLWARPYFPSRVPHVWFV